MHYVVFLLKHGLKPYREISDNNMPGAYFTEAVAMRIFLPVCPAIHPSIPRLKQIQRQRPATQQLIMERAQIFKQRAFPVIRFAICRHYPFAVTLARNCRPFRVR